MGVVGQGFQQLVVRGTDARMGVWGLGVMGHRGLGFGGYPNRGLGFGGYGFGVWGLWVEQLVVTTGAGGTSVSGLSMQRFTSGSKSNCRPAKCCHVRKSCQVYARVLWCWAYERSCAAARSPMAYSEVQDRGRESLRVYGRSLGARGPSGSARPWDK